MHNEKWQNVPQGRPARNKFAHESENINTMSQVQVQDASAKVIIKPSQNNRMPHIHTHTFIKKDIYIQGYRME